MAEANARFQWLSTAIWYMGAVIVSSIGTFLAYGPFSSDAWEYWSGANAWKRDVARAVVASLLAFFMLWNLESFAVKWKGSRDRHSFLPLRRYELIILIGVATLLLVFTFLFLPYSFRRDLKDSLEQLGKGSQIARRMAAAETAKDAATIEIAKKAVADEIAKKAVADELAKRVAANDFTQIRKPYFPYLLYVFGLWIGIVFPVFLTLLRRVRVDWELWRVRRSTLDSCIPIKLPSHAGQGSNSFEEFSVAFQNYVIGLKEVAERYVPVLLATSLVLLYEQLTTSHLTVTQAAVESGKLALWLLLGPALLICITMVALGYQNAADKAEIGLRAFAETLAKSHGKTELFDRVIQAREKLMWEESPAEFVVSVAKSATVAIPLLLALTAYVLHSLAGPEGWLGIFVPKAAIDFVQGLFR
jgi:hypothetical protein